MVHVVEVASCSRLLTPTNSDTGNISPIHHPALYYLSMTGSKRGPGTLDFKSALLKGADAL